MAALLTLEQSGHLKLHSQSVKGPLSPQLWAHLFFMAPYEDQSCFKLSDARGLGRWTGGLHAAPRSLVQVTAALGRRCSPKSVFFPKGREAGSESLSTHCSWQIYQLGRKGRRGKPPASPTPRLLASCQAGCPKGGRGRKERPADLTSRVCKMKHSETRMRLSVFLGAPGDETRGKRARGEDGRSARPLWIHVPHLQGASIGPPHLRSLSCAFP